VTEIWQLTAAELARQVRSKAISARQAGLAALDRLDAVNPRINAVVAHRREDVLAQADAVDAAIARGEDPGPLAGVPVTVKVNIDQAGFATTNGTRLQENLVAASNSPVVDNLRRAGAVILGRTNTPAFSLRWFTANLVHGATLNPRDKTLTPGGSSGGAAAALTTGIGHLAHGTDIAGSIRYPAYACGVHGLRPSFGRVAAYNATLAERPIGAQLTSVSGPLGRTIADLRLGLAAMAGPDERDPWWVPAPFLGPPAPRRAALCLRPGGMDIAPEVAAALLDAAARLRQAGWAVAEIADTPPLQEAATLQTKMWIGDGFAAWDDLVAREGDPGAIAVVNGLRGAAIGVQPADVCAALVRRTTLLRAWQAFLADTPVLLLPVSGELPFPDHLDLTDFDRVWAAQLTLIGLAFLGLPALTVATGMVGATPVGVQVVAGRFREDLCLAAGEAIEAGGVPPAPIDPV
jgi:amidase